MCYLPQIVYLVTCLVVDVRRHETHGYVNGEHPVDKAIKLPDAILCTHVFDVSE